MNRSAWDIPHRLTDDTGYCLKSELIRMESNGRRTKPVSKLMAAAIARRERAGDFSSIIMWELEISEETIQEARREWPHEFKAHDLDGNTAGQRTKRCRPGRTHKHKRRSHQAPGNWLLFDPQDQPGLVTRAV
jgi:hypothetical protein